MNILCNLKDLKNMSALPILIGAAALFFVVSSKKSTSKNSSTKKEDEIIYKAGDLQLKPTPSKGFGINSKVCTQDQYLNDKGDCSAFWNSDTEQLVSDAIHEEVLKLKNQSFDALCVDSGEFGNITPNQTPIKIARTVIQKLWPVLAKHSLPPKESDPKWIYTIWTRVINIYSHQICGFENKDPD